MHWACAMLELRDEGKDFEDVLCALELKSGNRRTEGEKSFEAQSDGWNGHAKVDRFHICSGMKNACEM